MRSLILVPFVAFLLCGCQPSCEVSPQDRAAAASYLTQPSNGVERSQFSEQDTFVYAPMPGVVESPSRAVADEVPEAPSLLDELNPPRNIRSEKPK